MSVENAPVIGHTLSVYFYFYLLIQWNHIPVQSRWMCNMRDSSYADLVKSFLVGVTISFCLLWLGQASTGFEFDSLLVLNTKSVGKIIC